MYEAARRSNEYIRNIRPYEARVRQLFNPGPPQVLNTKAKIRRVKQRTRIYACARRDTYHEDEA